MGAVINQKSKSDKQMFDRTNLRWVIPCTIAVLFSTQALADETVFDRNAVPVGTATYQLILNETKMGQMVYATRFEGDYYVIDEATAMQPDIKETATIILDGQTFLPVREIVDADFSGSILDIDVQFEEGRVHGEYRIKKPGDLEKRVVDFDKTGPADMLARSSLFGLAGALPLSVGAFYEFSWFSSLGGAIEPVRLEVEDLADVTVPAGSFETIPIRVKGASPENVIYVDVASKKVVRIDVVGQNMRFELMPDRDVPIEKQ